MWSLKLVRIYYDGKNNGKRLHLGAIFKVHDLKG